MKLSCIAIEDEPLALKRLQGFIQKVPFLDLLAVFENGLDALGYLSNSRPEVIFLDIEMDELSGISLLESLSYRPKVVLVTAYDHYAIRGFDLQVTDYLLKPYTFERFLQAVNLLSVPSLPLTDVRSIFIKTETRLEKVNLEDILYIEGKRDYRCIHFADKKMLTLETFIELDKQLPGDRFCRVHKSYMVAIEHIRSVERDRIVIGQDFIPISHTYKQQFYNHIKKIRTQ